MHPHDTPEPDPLPVYKTADGHACVLLDDIRLVVQAAADEAEAGFVSTAIYRIQIAIGQ